MVESSCILFVNMVETPCQVCLDVEDDFDWGSDLVFSPFRPSTQAIFLLTLKMNDMGPYYSTDPGKFIVSKKKYCIVYEL